MAIYAFIFLVLRLLARCLYFHARPYVWRSATGLEFAFSLGAIVLPRPDGGPPVPCPEPVRGRIAVRNCASGGFSFSSNSLGAVAGVSSRIFGGFPILDWSDDLWRSGSNLVAGFFGWEPQPRENGGSRSSTPAVAAQEKVTMKHFPRRS